MDNSFEQPITIVALIVLGYVFCQALSSKRKGKGRIMRGGKWRTGSKIAFFLGFLALACFLIGLFVCGAGGLCDVRGFMISAAVFAGCAFILGMSGT